CARFMYCLGSGCPPFEDVW
nr:immunoglobulin heavy chain junction region [Macaca mulatta]MOY22486.1 immunoglobulin heavy chain junction region [Macaca mulatta]MOY26572.1 immunoglobulin heavy chain junction region [Macaca mulatta]MOY27668.1 immunoglobulin heavy chain junction region [Macaca mulatta]MOY28304.1 immunoglobulin heavy chain junction region [Macaca mulatta]